MTHILKKDDINGKPLVPAYCKYITCILEFNMIESLTATGPQCLTKFVVHYLREVKNWQS